MEGSSCMLLSAFAATVLLVSGARANTVTQNTSWTIDRPGTSTTYRVTAYGDSIYAGYHGSISNVAKRAAPWVDGEYLSQLWGADIEVIRRAKSGAVASDIYNNKIVAERSYMQTTNTRVVSFEMCGNDGLQARSNFSGQSGTCNYAPLDNALANCTTYTQLAMQYIKQNAFLPYLARMNWRACNFAAQYGFACADSFAQFMGADYDSNGDGQIDSDGLRYVQGESEDGYVNRLAVTLRSTIRDANVHLVSANTSYDYIQSDNTHPTYTGSTIYVGFFGGTGTGSGPPDYSGGQIAGGKNPIWNQLGHERMGWALSVYNPATP